MAGPTASAQQPDSGRHSVAYNMAGIATLVLLAAVGIAYAIDQAGRNTRPVGPSLGDGNTIMQTVAGHDLAIPSSWFRFGEDIKPGFVSQVDLHFQLDLETLTAPAKVDVTLMPRSGARASAALLDAVYLHQFSENSVGGVPGLVGKPLVPHEGYANETVWYDPLSANPFVAKCAAAPEPNRPDRCLRTIHLPNGLAVVQRFDATTLAAWRQFDGELARWLGQIGAL